MFPSAHGVPNQIPVNRQLLCGLSLTRETCGGHEEWSLLGCCVLSSSLKPAGFRFFFCLENEDRKTYFEISVTYSIIHGVTFDKTVFRSRLRVSQK